MPSSQKHKTSLIPPKYRKLLLKFTALLQGGAVLFSIFFILTLFLPNQTGKPLCLALCVANIVFIILLFSLLNRIKMLMKETGLIVSNSKDLMWAVDSRLNITGACGALEMISGKDTMALLGKPMVSILPEDERDRFSTLVRENKPFSMTCTISGKEEGALPVEIRATPVHLAGQNTFHGVITDATDKKRIQALEKELRISKKLEALGRLTDSVAHDLNNILAGMATYPEILLLDKTLDPRVRDSLLLIKESGQNASAMVSDLLTISRSTEEEHQVLNLNSVIERFVAGPEFKKIQAGYKNIHVYLDLEPELLTMSGSYLHIEKSIMHLLINAFEQTAAKDNNGNIVLSTANYYMDGENSRKPSTGEDVKLEVRDTGNTIPRKDLDHIFDPLFTQKKMGRSGCGLGLTVVKNTVINHRGKLFALSDENGTTFTLLFPALRQELPLANQPVNLNEIKGKGETVLVVDDLASQRKIAETILKNLGYKVFSVANGITAFDFIMQTPVDLLILDMVMAPSISGLETLRRIKKRRPDQKAIIASGHSNSEDVLKALSEGAGAFVKKPFTIMELGIAVKEELDG